MRRPDAHGVTDMALLPVQLPHGAAQARARFYNSGNAFNQKLPAVPAAVFSALYYHARTMGFTFLESEA